MQWHGYFGYSIFTLVLFRIVWGLVGSTHARFANFIPSKTTLLNHLSGKSKVVLGHNPLGALSVLALILALLIQAITGLFSDDEIAFQGPLAKYLSEAAVSILSEIHEANSGLIYGLMEIGELQTAVEYGAAHGALAMTTPGDTTMATLAEVKKLAGGGSARVIR